METIIHNGIRYTAASLEDVASALDLMKADAERKAKASKTQKSSRYLTGEAAAYGHVADMLRRTTIVPAKQEEPK